MIQIFRDQRSTFLGSSAPLGRENSRYGLVLKPKVIPRPRPYFCIM